MVQTEVKRFLGSILWLLAIVAGGFIVAYVLPWHTTPEISWKWVPMDGHRAGVPAVTSENSQTAFGSLRDGEFVTLSGAEYDANGIVERSAEHLYGFQEGLAPQKQVVAHSARLLENLRTQPDLPLGNMMADALRAGAGAYYHKKIDIAFINYGGIRCPLPEGPVTLECMESMFPFNNYIVKVEMKGKDVRDTFSRLAATKAFMAVSGMRVKIVNHVLEEITVGGKPLDDNAMYSIATIDFLLLGGDNVRMVPKSVSFSKVLIKDVALDYVKSVEARGELLDAVSDGRVILEEK